MGAQEIICKVGPDGKVCFDMPGCGGKTVRIIYTCVQETGKDPTLHPADDLDFTAAACLLADEEDEAEDAVWEKYIR